MATVNLVPSSTVSNNWTVVGAVGTAHGALADSGSKNHIKTPDQNKSCIVELVDYLAGGTINSIQVKMLGMVFLTRSASFDVRIQLINGSDSSVYYNENVTIAFNSYTPTAANGTARTTSDGSAAWTTTELNNLRLAIDTTPTNPPASSQAQITYAYVEVDYTAPSGYGHVVNGIAAVNIGKVNAVATANIEKVIGV